VHRPGALAGCHRPGQCPGHRRVHRWAHRRRRASGSTPPATPPAAPRSCAGAGTGRFFLPRRPACSAGNTAGTARCPEFSARSLPQSGQDAFGCVLAGSGRIHKQQYSAEVTHRRPAPRAQSRCLLPHHQQPAPDLTTAAWDRRSPPTAFVAAPGPASRAARALQVWIDVLREGHPAAAGSSSARHLRPGWPASDRSWPRSPSTTALCGRSPATT
jgi:hypothetical protein